MAQRDSPSELLYVDQPSVAETIAAALDDVGECWDVVGATGVEDARNRIGNQRFDCIVSEYDLPDGNGIDLLEAVRDRDPSVPLVLYPGSGSEHVASEAIGAGVSDYVPKGDDPEAVATLADRIERVLVNERREKSVGTGEQPVPDLDVLDIAPFGVVVTDPSRPDNPIVYVNEEFLEMTGYDAEAVLGSNCRFLQGPDTDPEAIANLRAGIKAAEPVTVELENYRADGTAFWNRVTVAPVTDTAGDVTHFVGFQTDVTERKERDREHARRRSLLEAQQRAALDGFLAVDESREIISYNERFRDMWGLPESLLEAGDEQAALEAVEETVSDPEQFRRDIEGLYENPEVPARDEVLLENGRVFERYTAPIVGDEGVNFGRLWTFRDVTEQRRASEERETTVEFLRGLYDVTTDPDLSFEAKIDQLLELGSEKLDLPYGFLSKIETGEDGQQTIVQSRGSHELLQPGESCPLSEAYCRRAIDTDGLLAIQDALAAGWEDDPAYEVFELGSYVGGKVLVDGELYGTLCFASSSPRPRPFTESDRTLVRLMSKWASYELERQQTKAELERQNDRLEEFASIVSHDLRNPLNVAMARLELLEDCAEEHVDAIETAHERMETLIEDLLAVAREGARVADPEPVSIETVVEDCWDTVSTPDASLVVETDRTIQADPSQLQQLLENLIRNAVEHGGEDVRVTIGDRPNGFFVADDGPGIPPEDRDAVMESGYTSTDDGTGYGLAIVDAIANAHGWDVAVTESDDGGAQFEFTGVETA